MSEHSEKRRYCDTCQRPISACICKFTCATDNQVLVLVLQHPTEVKQTKGTVGLLAQSLSNIEVIVGEDFSDNEQVNQFIEANQPCYLLYPNEKAQVLGQFTDGDKQTPKSLILLDGTWKKAYRMFQLSKSLHQLPSVVLPEGIECLYQIRKTIKKQALSSYEACVNALALLEQDQAKYQNMLDNFIKFNEFQLSFTPSHHHSSTKGE